MSSRSLLGLLLACAAATYACGGADPATPGGPAPIVGATPPPGFLDRIPNAPSATAYTGKRRVFARWTVGGQAKTLDRIETVWSDGQGQFLILPGPVSTPAMSAQEAQFFALLQEKRDGFFFKHRDFRIRDLDLCLQNYSVADIGQAIVVAGRTCAQLELRRYDAASIRYRAAVDPQTGLVMRFEELDAQDKVLTSVEFVEFTLSPSVAGVALHGDLYGPTQIDPEASTTGVLGFQARPPRILPAGYRFLRADAVVEDGRHWARMFYGDGVEQVFFLHTETLPGQAATGGPEYYVGPKVLRVLTMGPWTMLEAQFGSRLMVAVGKVDENALITMIRSALP